MPVQSPAPSRDTAATVEAVANAAADRLRAEDQRQRATGR